MKTNSNKSLMIYLLRLTMTLILLAGMFGFLPADNVYADGSTIYVKAGAGGANNGTSWTDAYTGLQSALSAATSGKEIWVAAGTYYPTTGTNRSVTFALKNGVGVYGGFAGVETLFAERDPEVNVTVLSGDIGVSLYKDDNSFHVVTGSNTDTSAVLDGFTITAGHSLADPINPYGGGMYNQDGSPTLSNLIFSRNNASYGGGMFNLRASPTVTNVTFINNTADRAGGMYNNQNSNPTLTNVTFSGNTAAIRGGGMTVAEGSPTLTNVTFSGNTAAFGGALHTVFGGNPTLTNVTISGNTADVNGGGIYNEESNPVITNSIVYGNTGGEIIVATGSPVVTHSIVQGGYAGTGNLDGDPVLGTLQDNGGFTQTMALRVGSSAIDTGNNGSCPATDQRGVNRPQGVQCDIGAYEKDLFPTVFSIRRADANPNNSSSVNFTTTFSDPVIAVDAGDFALTTSCVIGASITNVSGSGDIYTVSVNTGTGKGTIRLDVVDNDSIKDGLNNPLGGPGAGNGNYTNGEVYTIAKTMGADTVGVFRPSNGLLYLKNQNTSGFADIAINYGIGGDYPVVGDWDGDGDVTIGVYRNGSFLLRNSNTLGFANLNFAFGQVGDQPVAGDWNGDCIDTIGVYRPSTGAFYLRNSNTAGGPDMSFYLGNVGDVGIAGDWNGDGIDTTGVFRPSNGILFLKNTNASGFADIAMNYGLPGDRPVVGDWDNNGTTTIGIYRNARFYLRNSNTNGFADIVLDLGIPGDMPIAGNWDGQP